MTIKMTSCFGLRFFSSHRLYIFIWILKFVSFQLDNEESVLYEDDLDEYNMIHVPIWDGIYG